MRLQASRNETLVVGQKKGKKSELKSLVIVPKEGIFFLRALGLMGEGRDLALCVFFLWS